MKINIINDDIILIDDFLTKDQMKEAKDEITKFIDEGEFRKFHTKDKNGFANTSYDRVYPYEDHPQSRIIKIMEETLFSKNLMKDLSKINSYSMQSYARSDFNETQITSYDNGHKYQWHRDHDLYRFASFVLPIEFINNSYTGGETRIIYNREIIKVKPIHNRLLLFTAHLLHDVTEIKIKDQYINDRLGKRFVINGHIGYNYIRGKRLD